MTAVSYLIILIFVLMLLYGIMLYNKLSIKKKQIQNAASLLDTLLAQRTDLIPNLIPILKKHVVFDEEMLQNISALGKPVNYANNKDSYLQPEEGSIALKQIIVQMQDYPELKFNRQFLQLKNAYVKSEEQITAQKQLLDSSIAHYNSVLVVFPSNILSKILGFETISTKQPTNCMKNI